MKPIFTCLTILFVAMAPARSQSPRWSLDLKVGGGMTGEWTDRDPRFLIPGGQIIERLNPRAGILFGMQLRYRFAKHWAVVTGLEYQTMSDHLYREGRTLEWELYKGAVIYSARRLQVPLQIRYAFTARPKSAP